MRVRAGMDTWAPGYPNPVGIRRPAARSWLYGGVSSSGAARASDLASTVSIELAPPPLRLTPTRAQIQRSRRVRRPQALVVVAVVVGMAALVAFFTLASAHAVVGNSDGATVVLEGQAMGSGNVLLHHWSLSYDSFWSVDALFYMLGALAIGVRPVLLHLVPAVLASLVVLTGCALARVGRRGTAAVAAVVTVGALLALPGRVLAVFFFQGPLHVGTILFCLLAFAGLRHGRLGWGWAAAVALLAAGALGDFQTVALGMVPAFAGGVVAMARTRDWRRGHRRPSPAPPVVGRA